MTDIKKDNLIEKDDDKEKGNIYFKMARLKLELQKIDISKSGTNKHAGFKYYELKDFMPLILKLMKEYNLLDVFSLTETKATLQIINGSSSVEKIDFEIFMQEFDVPMTNAGKQMMQKIQYLGAIDTYYRRYIYLNAFGITEGETIDSMESTNSPKKLKEKSEIKLTYSKEVMDEFVKFGKKQAKINDVNIQEIAKEYKITSKSTDNDLNVAIKLLKDLDEKLPDDSPF